MKPTKSQLVNVSQPAKGRTIISARHTAFDNEFNTNPETTLNEAKPYDGDTYTTATYGKIHEKHLTKGEDGKVTAAHGAPFTVHATGRSIPVEKLKEQKFYTQGLPRTTAMRKILKTSGPQRKFTDEFYQTMAASNPGSYIHYTKVNDYNERASVGVSSATRSDISKEARKKLKVVETPPPVAPKPKPSKPIQDNF